MSLYSAELMEDVGRSIGKDIPIMKEQLIHVIYMVIDFIPKITSYILSYFSR